MYVTVMLSTLSQASWHIARPDDGVMLSERACAMSKHLNPGRNQLAQNVYGGGRIPRTIA